MYWRWFFIIYIDRNMDYYKYYKKYKMKYNNLLFGGGDHPPPPRPRHRNLHRHRRGRFIQIADGHVTAAGDSRVFQIETGGVLGTLYPGLIGKWAIRATVRQPTQSYLQGPGTESADFSSPYLGYVVGDQDGSPFTHHVIEYQLGDIPSYRRDDMRGLLPSEVHTAEHILRTVIATQQAVPVAELPEVDGSSDSKGVSPRVPLEYQLCTHCEKTISHCTCGSSSSSSDDEGGEQDKLGQF